MQTTWFTFNQAKPVIQRVIILEVSKVKISLYELIINIATYSNVSVTLGSDQIQWAFKILILLRHWIRKVRCRLKISFLKKKLWNKDDMSMSSDDVLLQQL